jgi:hypothetical protein
MGRNGSILEHSRPIDVGEKTVAFRLTHSTLSAERTPAQAAGGSAKPQPKSNPMERALADENAQTESSSTSSGAGTI